MIGSRPLLFCTANPLSSFAYHLLYGLRPPCRRTAGRLRPGGLKASKELCSPQAHDKLLGRTVPADPDDVAFLFCLCCHKGHELVHFHCPNHALIFRVERKISEYVNQVPCAGLWTYPQKRSQMMYRVRIPRDMISLSVPLRSVWCDDNKGLHI